MEESDNESFPILFMESLNVLKYLLVCLILLPVTNFTDTLPSFLLWTLVWDNSLRSGYDYIQLLNIFTAPVYHLIMLPMWYILRIFVSHFSLRSKKLCFLVRELRREELMTCQSSHLIHLVSTQPPGFSRIVCKDLLLTLLFYLVLDFIAYQPVWDCNQKWAWLVRCFLGKIGFQLLLPDGFLCSWFKITFFCFLAFHRKSSSKKLLIHF